MGFWYNCFTLLSILLLTSCKDNPNKVELNFEPGIIRNVTTLQKDTVEIVLEYYGMACPCPQWATPADVQRYNASQETDNPIPIDSLFISIEPADSNSISPLDLEYGSSPTFKFKGSFYTNKREWIAEDGAQFNNRVFKYFECKRF